MKLRRVSQRRLPIDGCVGIVEDTLTTADEKWNGQYKRETEITRWIDNSDLPSTGASTEAINSQTWKWNAMHAVTYR